MTTTTERPIARVRPAWFRLLVLVPGMVVVLILGQLVDRLGDSNPIGALLAGAVVVAGSLYAYKQAIHWLERRPATEIARDYSGLRKGLAFGAGLAVLVMALIGVCNGLRFHSGGSLGGAMTSLGLMAGAAVVEELLFRAVLFRLVEEVLGTWGAIAVSALLFGAAHLANPDASLWGAISIAIEAGVMLGAAYALTRNLWLAVGLHFAWNFVLSGFFGAEVSGEPTRGLLHTASHGATAVSGGQFGPEASIFSILACSVLAFFFLRAARRQGRIR